jgi:hypothetical protein
MQLLSAAVFRMSTFLIAMVLAGGALVHAQDLGEAAAREKERRAKIHGSGKSFSDSELQEARAKREREGSAASAKPPAAKDGGKTKSAGTADEANDTAAVESAKRARGLELKTRLAAVNTELTAAEGRLKEAERQWDSVYMHSVGYPLEQAAAALETARKEAARLRQERYELEEAARREGIPPGYMR